MEDNQTLTPANSPINGSADFDPLAVAEMRANLARIRQALRDADGVDYAA